MANKFKGIIPSKVSEITLKDLQNLNSKEAYSFALAKMGKHINRHFVNMEKQGIENSSTAYRRAQIELNDKEKPRYSETKNVYEKMDIKELRKMAKDMLAKVNSPTLGIKNIRQLNIKKLKSSYGANFQGQGRKPTQKEYDDFLRSGGGELMNTLSSSQVTEAWESALKKGVSTDEFLEAFNKYKVKNEVDWEAIEREFDIIL